MTWAIDLNSDGAALMIALLTDNGQQVLYIPGRTSTMPPAPTRRREE